MYAVHKFIIFLNLSNVLAKQNRFETKYLRNNSSKMMFQFIRFFFSFNLFCYSSLILYFHYKKNSSTFRQTATKNDDYEDFGIWHSVV